MLRHTSTSKEKEDGNIEMTKSIYQDMNNNFENVISFLKENQWIYNYPNTHILVNKVFAYFPEEWVHSLKEISNTDLNNIPFGIINGSWPTTLKTFINDIEELESEINNYGDNSETPELPNNIRVSEKKQHEIVSLAVVVQSICKQHNISTVIDVGAGLGYLSQLLFDKYNYKVLAIEGNKNYIDVALKNQNKFYPNSKHHVKYVHHFITEDSVSNLKHLLESNFEEWKEDSDPICVTGLHACADLSVTILNIFSQLDFVKSLIIMPCCYHRLELQDVTENEERFKNFPTSVALKSVYFRFNGEEFLRRPFLRLACQQSKGSWRSMSLNDHSVHSKSCIYRAIVQEVAAQDNLDVRRLKRKTGRFKTDSNCNIEDYVNNLKHTHELIAKDVTSTEFKVPLIDDPIFKSKILEKWNQHKENCYLVEILTAFQTAIQSVCENVVLLDRVEFLREKGLECNVYKVTDDRISPRCHALVATKP